MTCRWIQQQTDPLRAVLVSNHLLKNGKEIRPIKASGAEIHPKSSHIKLGKVCNPPAEYFTRLT